jgi:galactokinase
MVMGYSPTVTGLTTVAARAAGVGGESFPDADAFCARVRRHALFAPGEPIAVTRAPGRLDVLGGIGDYAGGLVLGLPIRAAALAAAQIAGDGCVVAVSGTRRISLRASELVETAPADLARRFSGEDAWAAYVLGPVALLAREERMALPGVRLLIASDVPEGKGLGSSAAVEIAAVTAVSAALGVQLEPRRAALLGQRSEHLLAGAPCGVMDQMTAALGEAARLLALICRPAEIAGSFALPAGLAVWGIDSGARHAVHGAPYKRARCASFIGKALLGTGVRHLTELELDEIEPERLPERMTGAEFLRVRDGVDDDTSFVEADVEYPVRAATLHPIEEQVRVETFLSLLDAPVDASSAHVLGELMAASHDGYSRCGLGTPVTDRIAAAVRASGWAAGLIGARVSGGGSGGTVVVLGREDAEPVVRALSETLGAGLVGGTSSGAASFGTRLL